MKPNLLYHYTSIEALYAIIDEIYNKYGEDKDAPTELLFKLRATHASYLNDFSEGRLLPEALKILGANEELLFIIQNTLGYPFVVSLSELGDDLNMWRCYANKGKGISLGIDRAELDNAVKEENDCRLDKCKYVTINELVKLFREKQAEKMIASKDIKSLYQLLRELLIYKDNSFRAEEEWRIHDFNYETNYRIGNNLIIPYREIKIPVSAIQTITIGPKCDYEKNHFSLYRMLNTKLPPYHRVKIIRSNVPLE